MAHIDPNETDEFQKEIAEQEYNRAISYDRRRQEAVDVILVDRTRIDNYAYLLFNMVEDKYKE